MSRIALILYLSILLLIGGYILFNRSRQIATVLYVVSAVAGGLALVGFLEMA